MSPWRFWCERQKPDIFAETRLLRKRTGMLSIADLFKGRHFDREIIILCVRWYLRFKLSFRDLVEMMAERGISLSHTTIMRWIARYVPEFEKRWNRIIAPRAVSIARHARPRLLHTPAPRWHSAASAVIVKISCTKAARNSAALCSNCISNERKRQV